MIDLRFVERKKFYRIEADREIMAKEMVLQWRTVDQFGHWGEWEDVRIEAEA